MSEKIFIGVDNLDRFRQRLIDKKIPKNVEITQEAYNQLSPEEKNNGTFYYIKDAEPIIKDEINAEQVIYDENDNIKNKIDELNQDLTSLESKITDVITSDNVTVINFNFSQGFGCHYTMYMNTKLYALNIKKIKVYKPSGYQEHTGGWIINQIANGYTIVVPNDWFQDNTDVQWTGGQITFNVTPK